MSYQSSESRLCIDNGFSLSGLPDKDILDETPTAAGENCCICLDGFDRVRGVRLSRCRGHWFHLECIKRAFAVRPNCPYCSEQYGQTVGSQPAGQMVITRIPEQDVAGFEGAGLIKICYTIPFGYQEAYHPAPGVPYDGTIRKAYLPGNSEGTGNTLDECIYPLMLQLR